MNPKVNFYFEADKKWAEEIMVIRELVLKTGLEESLKWGVPCYSLNNANIVLIHVFKEYCALLFFKGSIMQDPNHILIQQTENVQAARQIRFTNLKGILDIKEILKSYILHAIEIEKTGLKVELKKAVDFVIPIELEEAFLNHDGLKSAFGALSPGRQRAYILFFTSPKQTETRTSRILKNIPKILIGKGLND